MGAGADHTQLTRPLPCVRYGPDKINDHYFEFDTICDATQTRQDAVTELCDTNDETGLDFILVCERGGG